MIPLFLTVVMGATAGAPPVSSAKAVVFSGGSARAGQVELRLFDALGRAGVEVVDLEARFPPPDTSAEEGERLAKEGREAYDNLDTEAAVAKLGGAANFFETNAQTIKVEQLSEIFVFLGASQLQNGNTDDAKKSFLKALYTWPQTSPDVKLFGADVQKAFEAAKKEFRGDGSKAKLLVSSEPSGGVVSVRGQKVGETPMDAPVEVEGGRLPVLVTRKGYADWGGMVDAKPGATTEAKAQLVAVPALVSLKKRVAPLLTAAAFGAAQQSPEARAIAQDAGARYLVLANVDTEVSVQVWDTQDGKRLKDVKFRPGDGAALDAAAQSIHDWLTRPAEVAKVAKPSGLPGVFKEWWFWAAVGGGVVVAGTVTGIAVGASQPSAPAYNVLFENH